MDKKPINKKSKKIEFEKVCRTCLSENQTLKAFNKQLIDMLKACASVNDADGLPNNICIRCYHELNRFFIFKKKVERCEIKLKKLLIDKNKKSKKIITIDGVQNNDETVLTTDTKNSHQTRSVTKRAAAAVKASDLNLVKVEVDELSQFLKVKDDEIFLSEPPPLVPLIPIAPEEIPDFPVDTKFDSVELALRPLSDETPPLIPIKSNLPKPIPALDALSTAMANSNIIVPTFTCPTCTEEFSDPLELKSHMTNMHLQNSLLLTCNICKKEFADRNRLIGHLKGHTVQKLYMCKICGKRYPNPSTFKVHMRTHTGERPFKCQICNKGFIRWAGVVGHMKSHNEAKPYECEICQRGFKMQSNLERHKILHTGEMRFCCSYCGKTFTQNDNLQLHVRTYHTNERPYLCNECGKSFVSSTRLKRHMWVHTGYKRYICQHCPKSYSNLNDLKIHTTRTHGNGSDEQEKPYPCAICDMRFFHPCRLAKHLKTHERPYSCTECSRTFSREDTLNKHVNKKHGIIMITQQADEDQLEEEQDIKISVTTTDTEEHIIFCT
ncbi:zinc finger protein 182-like isoform X2 [Chrysoperla carnea]|uniref:zinc finger protein 182-like isoform X2 n=1 Tax=Chrysoperla carnea TaxID=189513 RepID=UPI001D079542|nr:zinc finger protein 182-like isoform X2 [Chrysoperla carnea]